MLKPPRPYSLREMRISDISSVMEIERTAFPVPWKASAYEYEIAQNKLASYQVLTAQLADLRSSLIGYTGYWMLVDEAHVSTLAIGNAWRGRGLGELLLLNLLILAFQSKASIATLEVRKSNLVAQNLYRKYQFQVVGGRRRYYQGKEDALVMSVETLDQVYWSFLKTCKRELFNRLNGQFKPVARAS